MADIVRAVHRLLERAQHHGLQELHVRSCLDLVEQLGVVGCARFVATAQAQPELGEEGAQFLELFLGRRLMDAVQRRVFTALQEVRRADVGGQHAFLDQPVRVVPHLGHDPLDLALLVEDHPGLGGLEVDRAALGARLQQHPEHLVEVFQMRQQFAQLIANGRILLVQGGGDLGVGQPGMREHHRRIEAIGLDLAGQPDAHVADHAQPLDLRIQRTQPVRQLFRQHRNHPSREIHRVAAVAPFMVERAARLHIVRHIGDRDDQPVAAPLPLAIHRIVEILGSFAVDGDQR